MNDVSNITNYLDLNTLDVPNTIFLYVGAGVVFVLFSIVLIIVLFAIATKKSTDSYSGIAVLVLLLITLPTLIVVIGKKTYFKSSAEYHLDTSEVEVLSMNDEFFVVTYNTSSPEISYIEVTTEDGSVIPVLPTYSLEKRVDHTILVPKYMRTQKVYIVVKGKNYQIHL